ncbi:MAG: DUF1444 family protein [Bacteroidota bacterium]
MRQFLKYFTPEWKFTKRFFKILKEAAPDLELVQMKPLLIKIKYKDFEITNRLNNAYAEYSGSNPEEKEEITQRYIKALQESLVEKRPLEKNSIFPYLKDRHFIESIQQNFPETRYAFEQYNEDLFVMYVIDLEHSIYQLTHDDLDRLGYYVEDLQALAVDNMLSSLPDIALNGEERFYVLTAGGNYESSLILYPSLWNNGTFSVWGDLVVGIPARDILMITGSEDSENLDLLKTAVDDIYQNGDHIVSNQLFVWKDDRFEVFVP